MEEVDAVLEVYVVERNNTTEYQGESDGSVQ